MNFVFKHPSKYKKQKKEVSGYYIADGKMTVLYDKKQSLLFASLDILGNPDGGEVQSIYA